MKELKNLKTLDNKNLLVVLPINKIDREILNESLYALAMQTEGADVVLLVSEDNSEESLKELDRIAEKPQKRVFEKNEDGTPVVNMVDSEKTLNYAIEKVNAKQYSEAFNYGFNLALENGYKWFALVESDDIVEGNWIHNFKRYSAEKEEVSIFLPLVRQVTAGNMTGHLNEATWLEGRAEVAGHADLQLLMTWNCLSPSGCMFRVEDVKEYSEERDGKYYPFKENMNIASSYEFFLRMIYEDLKAYTIPRYGYQMRRDVNSLSFDKLSSKVPSNITTLSKENGGMTSHEIGFWMEQAKSEYFMSEDREIEYEAPVA
jgi:hypothetical protein